MDLRGKVVVVSGGGSGLGRATAVRMAAAGARVSVWDAHRAAAQETGRLTNGVALTVDVTSAEQVEAAQRRTVDEFGGIHVAVACAGIAPAAKVVSRGAPASLEGFRSVLDVNLLGTFNVVRVAAAAMLANEPDAGERGVIVMTASGAAFDGQVGQAGYSASKAGVVGMTLPLARDLAGKGVRVNTIAPGMFGTAMVAGFSQAIQDSLVEMALEPRRPGDPGEYAALVEHIVSNAYLNAECIRLDAGMRMSSR